MIQNEKLTETFIKENALRLVVQIVIFLLATLAAYYALRQDIALVKQQVQSNYDVSTRDRAEIISRLTHIEDKMDTVLLNQAK